MGVHDNIYTGHSCVGMVTVGTAGRKSRLPNRTDLKNYTPDAGKFSPADHFDWGCESPACYQLGLSILAYEFGDNIAMSLHEEFTERFICPLNEDENWTLDTDALEKAMMQMAS